MLANKQLSIFEIINKKFDDKEIEDIISILRFLFSHANKEKYVRIVNRIDYYSSYNTVVAKNYKVKQLLSKSFMKQLLENEGLEVINLFHSVNTYGNKKEASEDKIHEIHAMIIDVDYRKSIFSKLSQDSFLNLLEDEYFDNEIPHPSVATFTGNNLHLIYKFKYPVRATNKSKALFRLIQKTINKKITELGTDKNSNLTTLTRFTHTYNSKNLSNEVKVKIYDNVELQEMRYYQENLLPDLPKDYKPKLEEKKNNKTKKGKKARVYVFRTTYTMLKNRLTDLEKLQELREYNCRGYRQNMCFLYRNFCMQMLLESEMNISDARDESEKMMLKFNERFLIPLKSNRVESSTRLVERKQYNFKNETLIEWLDITLEEQKHMLNIILDEEYQRRQKLNQVRQKERQKEARRNENGLTQREQEKRDKINQIKKLHAEGLKQKEIAKKLGINQSNVSRYLNL